MVMQTARLSLPLLAAAQAQKEMVINEALTRADATIAPVVVAVAPASIPASPSPGQCWVVGPSPSGAWAGQANALAMWTEGGWRFIIPFEGMSAWSVADTVTIRFASGNWLIGAMTGASFSVAGLKVLGNRQAHIGPASGGATVDTQARGAIVAILAALEAHGLVATA